MKAKAWSEQLNLENLEQFFKEFAAETEALANERTKFSKDPKQRAEALLGVVREQRQKFFAVVRRVNDAKLTDNQFVDMVIGIHLPTIGNEVAKYEESKKLYKPAAIKSAGVEMTKDFASYGVEK